MCGGMCGGVCSGVCGGVCGGVYGGMCSGCVVEYVVECGGVCAGVYCGMCGTVCDYLTQLSTVECQTRRFLRSAYRKMADMHLNYKLF